MILRRQDAPLAARQRGMLRFVLRTAWPIVGTLALLVSVAGIPARIVELWTPPPPVVLRNALVTLGAELLIATTFLGAAGLIAWRARSGALGLALASTLAALGATESGMSDALINPAIGPIWQLAHWPVLGLRWAALSGSLLLLYTFPSGRFTPRWTLALAALWAALVSAWLVLPDLPFNAIYGPTWRRTPLASFLVSFGWLGSGLLAQALRYRHAATPAERRQILWWALGCGAAFLGGVWQNGLVVIGELWPYTLPALVYEILRPVGHAALLALLPVCLAIGMLRHQLLDVTVIISRTLVYGSLSAGVISLYLLLVAALGLLGGAHGALENLIIVCTIALLVQPLRDKLQQVVNRLLYGQRDDPYAVIARLNRRLKETFSVDAALPMIVETVAQTLKLPYVAIVLHDPQGGAGRSIAFGVRPDQPSAQDAVVALPLSYQGIAIGELQLAPRGGEPHLAAVDLRLLENLAIQVGIVAHDLRVSTDLQQSRARLVSAREEERRRIRRDLHDGLGPTLASLSFRIAAARNLVRRDPAAAEALLEQASEQFAQTIDEVRQLVYALRPPALDELGLVAALRQAIDAQLCGPVQITLEAPAPLPTLPAAVEVAAYRVALEALTNVLRHAKARRCWLTIQIAAEDLVLTVRDDGVGMALTSQAGIGVTTMRERTAELGGSCTILPAVGGGTVVQAWLPLHGAASSPAQHREMEARR